jgi:hypothetical protein
MALSFRDLVDRRVPQYLAVYLGAGWGLVEFFSFLEERFSLSPDWTNIVLFAWAMLIPERGAVHLVPWPARPRPPHASRAGGHSARSTS